MNNKKQIEVLITGTTGVGKSTLINGLAGKHVAETENDLLSVESKKVSSYTVNVSDVTAEKGEGGIDAVLWDSPDLQGSSESGYSELKQKFDKIIYCIDSSATRSSGLTAADVAENDLSAINKLTFTFGSDWWKRSIFVMTRANVLESALKVKPDLEKRFDNKLREWRERIVGTLIATGVPEKVACEIPVEPAGHPKKPRLPGRDDWARALWRTIVTSAALPSAKEQITPAHEEQDCIYASHESEVHGTINPQDQLSRSEECRPTPDQEPLSNPTSASVAPLNPTSDSVAPIASASIVEAPLIPPNGHVGIHGGVIASIVPQVHEEIPDAVNSQAGKANQGTTGSINSDEERSDSEEPINPQGTQANYEDGQKAVDSVGSQGRDEVLASINRAADSEAPISGNGRMEILVTGTSGVGKSTLINGLAGKRVAETENHLLPVESKDVSGYAVNVKDATTGESEGGIEGGIEAVLWDSPGLEGSSEITEIKEKCVNVDKIIYCIDMSATRSSGLTDADIEENDLSVIKKLTATFGSDLWKRSIFVMTRANVLESALKVKPDPGRRFDDKLREWRERIVATLVASGVPEEVACEIPVEPAGHPKKLRLPGRDDWLRALWRTIVTSAALPSATELPRDEQDFPPQGPESACEEDHGTSDAQFDEKNRGKPESETPAYDLAHLTNPQVSLSTREEEQGTLLAEQGREARNISTGVTTKARAGPGTTAGVERGPIRTELEEGVSWRAVHFPGTVVYLKVLKKVQRDAVAPTYPASGSVSPINPQARVSTREEGQGKLSPINSQDHESTCEDERNRSPATATAGLRATEFPAGASADSVSWRAVDTVVYMKVYPKEFQRETQV